MLQFLPLIATGLNLLSAASAAKQTSKGYTPPPAENAALEALGLQKQATANQSRLIQALLNPNDTITKNIMAGERQQLNDETQRGLSNLLAANRKAQIMGRQTFFNPERQDEAISQFLTRQSDVNANTSRSNALNRILSAAGQYGNTAGGYGNVSRGYSGMIPNQQAAQNINSARQPTLFGAAADMLKSGGSMSNIFSMLTNRGGSSWLNPDTGAYQ